MLMALSRAALLLIVICLSPTITISNSYKVFAFTGPLSCGLQGHRYRYNYQQNDDYNVRSRISCDTTTTTATSETVLSMVSIGIGPMDNKDQKSTDDDDDADRKLVAGIDYEIPNHEEYRTSRRSKLDELCDEWYEKLLYDGAITKNEEEQEYENENENENEQQQLQQKKQRIVGTGCLSGTITDSILQKLLTPVELSNDIEKEDRTDEEWTPYVTTKLPWTPLVPSYGLEQFGIPIVRRNSEQWRHFDVPGLISIDYSNQPIVQSATTTSTTTAVESTGIKSDFISQIQFHLQTKGIWVTDELCDGRLVYINGKFCTELSKSTSIACTINSAHLDNDHVVQYLSRLTDGFTDELVHPVYVDDETIPLTKLSKLSAPNHNVGLATSQFAINTQLGTASFAALNTIKCNDVAYVHVRSNTNTLNNHNDDDNNNNKNKDDSNDIRTTPIVSVVNVVTKQINTRIPAMTMKEENVNVDASDASTTVVRGTSIHPRLLVITEPNTRLELIQNCIDFDTTPTNIQQEQQQQDRHHTPKLINGYTQLFIDTNSNVTHTYVNEYGGDYITTLEDRTSASTTTATTTIDDANKGRSELQDTTFETIDVHVNGGYYSGTDVLLSTLGRIKVAHSITLLQSGSVCELNGLSVAGTGSRTDIKTNIHHIGDGCISKQLQKNLVGGKVTSTAFRGRIRVEESAQQTDSQQLSRTVLLSDQSVRAWTVPSLEILADDVKCTHGATVSDLSEEEVFYLRSRGINPLLARNLLMYAFCDDIVKSTIQLPLQPASTSTSTSTLSSSNTVDSAPTTTTLRERISKRLDQLVPRGPRAVQGEYQSI